MKNECAFCIDLGTDTTTPVKHVKGSYSGGGDGGHNFEGYLCQAHIDSMTWYHATVDEVEPTPVQLVSDELDYIKDCISKRRKRGIIAFSQLRDIANKGVRAIPYVTSDNDEIRLTIPYNLTMFEELKKILEELGWDLCDPMGKFYETIGKRYYNFTKDGCMGVRLSVGLDPNKQGSTCRLVEIGVVTEKTYAIECL